MPFHTIVINTPQETASFTTDVRPDNTKPRTTNKGISRFFQELSAGMRPAAVALRVGAVPATATLTLTGLPTAAQTFTLCGTSFTAIASGATGNQFNIGADATATAANIVTTINNSVSAAVAGVVTASSVAGVVTITAVVPGVAGNGYTLAETLDNTTAANFSGGSNGTLYSF